MFESERALEAVKPLVKAHLAPLATEVRDRYARPVLHHLARAMERAA